MAPPRKPKNSDRPAAGSADPRFAAISSDPRYRLPSTKNARVAVDKRFARMFKDDDFNRKPKVDKYGRRVQKSDDNDKLRRLYQAEEDEEEDEDEDDEVEEVTVKKGAQPKQRREIELASASEDEESDDADEDDAVQAELQRVGSARDFAREGFSSSEDDSSDDEDLHEEDLEAELPEESEANAVPMGDISRRVAIVNLDWDNIRAMDLMAVANSFVPSDGIIEQVSVYPSEFGKERMEKEELEGPPREIFAKSRREMDEDDEEEDSEEEEERIRKELQKGDTGEEFDSAKLRRYQLDRLKYFYAVITCTTATTAKALYDAMDGREYLSTSNFFDLRFIPDEVSFDEDRPRDECKKIPTGYKPNEFVTDALTHSKVKLTWDNDDTTRKEVQKRAFSRAEIDENDLQAYIGSESSEDEEEDDGDAIVSGSKADKEAQRQKMREALGLSSMPVKATKAANGPVGDMQITFTSGLSNAGKKNGTVFENGPGRDESTKEMYVRKERERKERRRAKAKAAREGGVVEDEHSGAEAPDAAEGTAPDPDGDDPFNDPFFNDAPAAQKAEKAQRKADRIKKREERQQEEKAAAAKRAELELLMVDDKEDNMKHFNMNEIQKAEKMKRKGKKSKKNAVADDAAVDDGFKVETQDPRFASLFESHEYAIDPTNPRYKGTEGMKALLNEGRKRRKNRPEQGVDAVEAEEERASKKAKKTENGEPDLAKLVAKVKGRSKKA
ncbi:hypothetical protein MBLNU457_1335t1 [Dothideomycetes sp. NU457]